MGRRPFGGAKYPLNRPSDASILVINYYHHESKPVIDRAEGSLLPPGFHSTPVVPFLVIGGIIVWMYGHVTTGRRPANRARQFQIGLT